MDCNITLDFFAGGLQSLQMNSSSSDTWSGLKPTQCKWNHSSQPSHCTQWTFIEKVRNCSINPTKLQPHLLYLFSHWPQTFWPRRAILLFFVPFVIIIVLLASPTTFPLLWFWSLGGRFQFFGLRGSRRWGCRSHGFQLPLFLGPQFFLSSWLQLSLQLMKVWVFSRPARLACLMKEC